MAQGLFFRKVLADQAIGVLIQAPLPGMIGLGKIALAMQGGSDRFMAGKLQAIVEGYGMNIFLMKQQQTDDFLGYQLGLFIADVPHQRPSADSFTESYQIADTLGSYHQVPSQSPRRVFVSTMAGLCSIPLRLGILPRLSRLP